MPYKQGDRWRGTVMINGERRSAIFQTKKEALAWESQTRNELKNAKPLPPGMDLMTFCGDYLDYAEQFSQKVYYEKKDLCRRIMVAWGADIMVDQVTPQMVSEFLMERARAVSNNAYNKDRKNLLVMWSWGEDIHDLESNPIRKIKKRRHEPAAKYVPPTSDILAVLAAVTREERVLLNCYLQTAARRSEIFRLRWNDDINFERREIRLGTRKTADGNMKYTWLPMSSDLHADLWWWFKNRPLKDSPWVFPLNRPGHFHHGKPLVDYRNFLKRICERAGVKPFQFHALRHYVASMLADTHKQSLKTVQRILRHASPRTTERYLHGLNQDLSESMEMLSEKNLPRAFTPDKKKDLVEND